MPKYFPFLLAAVFAVSPLAVDMYLPAIPAIAVEMDVYTQSIAVTVSLYIMGLGLGHLIGGPVSDYKGRRPVMFLGLLLFAIGSLLLALTENLYVFWTARVLQAFGGGLSSVVVPAMIRDRMTGQKAAKLFSLIAFITIFVPAAAPSLGTLVMHISSWRMIFVFTSVYALIILWLTWRYLRMPALEREKPDESTLFSRYAYVLKHKSAMRYLLAHGLTFSVLMTFVANASLVYIEQYGISEALFSVLFAANIITMMFFNRMNNWLLNHYASARILVWAIMLQLSACVILLMMTYFMPPLWLVVPMVMLIVGSLGGVIGNTQACCLHFFPNHSGVASSLLGSAQYLIGALVSAVSTQFYSFKMWPMTVTMFIAALLAMIIIPKDFNIFDNIAENDEDESGDDKIVHSVVS